MDDDLVASFIGITAASESQAIQMLEATGFNLEEAIELFFAAGGDMGGGAGGAPSASAPQQAAGDPSAGLGQHDDDEALARRLQQEANQAGPVEEQVRAPLPSKVERLYGDYDMAPRPGQGRGRLPVPANVVDAFRDFGSGEGGSGGTPGSGGNRLASMFEPPRDLLFHGNFEEAKAHAASLGRWLIVNLQSTSQFASHQLNRDTWRDSTVHALIESSFVLFQTYDVTDEGQKLLAFYHAYEVPATFVVDPVTGAPMRHWTGFMEPHRMSESLSPFLDTSFSDPGAARLAASLRRKKSGISATASGNIPASKSGSGSGPIDMGDDDAELQAALQASMMTAGGGSGGGRPVRFGGTSRGTGGEDPMEIEDEMEGRKEEEDEDWVDLVAEAAPEKEKEEEEKVLSGPSAEEVAAAAEARLPEETAGAEGCRVAVRFQDGSRAQRRFPRSALLRSVHDWCIVKSMDAAAGRPFFLSEAAPGAPPLSDLDQTLEAAGVADAMLVMKWAD